MKYLEETEGKQDKSPTIKQLLFRSPKNSLNRKKQPTCLPISIIPSKARQIESMIQTKLVSPDLSSAAKKIPSDNFSFSN